MEVCNSQQSCEPETLLLSSPEASRPEMRGIQYLRYIMSAAHPEYPVHQKYQN